MAAAEPLNTGIGELTMVRSAFGDLVAHPESPPARHSVDKERASKPPFGPTTNRFAPHERLPTMHCPSCYARLEIADRSGIEIDFCPSCRGIWLDKGELDKIIERSAANVVRASTPARADFDFESRDKVKTKKKKKREWLEDIFDLFD